MHTDTIPKKKIENSEYQRSDELRTIVLPEAQTLRNLAAHLKTRMARLTPEALAAVRSLAEGHQTPLSQIRKVTLRVDAG